MQNNDLKFLNAFNSIPNVGPVTLRTLKKHFGNYENAWRASETEFKNLNIREDILRAIIWKKPSLQPDQEMIKLVRENIWTLTENDPSFPTALREIPNSPIIIYGRGQIKNLQGQTLLAVVGTRKPTQYGLEAASALTRELTEAGITIISGLAMGIDARAHETTVENKGKTIAVLGSGVNQDSIFPPENRGLARRILENDGTIISEYAPSTPAVKEHFPARNRIISGLSKGVLVIEAREKSGALITAGLALEQNREVFALPGSIFSLASAGPNKLLQQGAKAVISSRDILEELGIDYNKVKEGADELLTEKENLLLELLDEPLNIDVVKEKTGLETSTIVASISLLELKGKVRNLGGDTYQRT
jgi:DNA processing protein